MTDLFPTCEEKPRENGSSAPENTKERKGAKEEAEDEEDDAENAQPEKSVNGSLKEKESPKISKNKPNVLDHVNIKREAINRVKLYVLCEQRVWDDRGTGHVMCINSTDDENPSNTSSFVILVRLEAQDKNVLESRILMDTVYQKQQETLIVWSESDTCDLALSFQEKTGCEEIWAKICEVQGRDPDGGYEDIDDSDGGEPTATSRLALPPITSSRLSEFDGLLQMHLATSAMREKMANTIENENVLPKLCDLFTMMEDIGDSDALKLLHSIAKNLFMLNRTSLNELLVDDRYMKSLIGMLEYDTAYDTPRKHREFLYEKAKFKEVIPISNEELKEKIHKTYRVQYIQDVCLPSIGLFEENLLSALNSYIFFSRVDILTMLQKDKKLIKELFDQLRDKNTSTEKRKELALFLKEFVTLSGDLPPSGTQSKENFFKNLQNNDVLGTVEPCIRSEDIETRCAVVETLAILVEHNSQLVRDYLYKQAKDKEDDDVLLNMIIVHMNTDKDPDVTSGFKILKTLLDMENGLGVKSDRNEFMHFFYQRCIHTLMKPVFENTEGGVQKKDDYMTANRLSLIFRLLGFCIDHHSYAMRSYCISNDILNQVFLVLHSKHHFLVLYLLKMLRKVLAKKDEFYYRYIVREKVLDPIIECFKRNGNRYNLLNSATLELFDFIRTEDIKLLIKYIVENHMQLIESVTYVMVFADLKLRYDMHKDKEESANNSRNEERAASSPKFKKERQEEQWFDDDEEEEDEEEPEFKKEVRREESPRKTGIEPMFPSVLKRKNAIDDDDAAVFDGAQVASVQLAKKIVIKVNTERSRTPSPSTSPRTSPSPSREDEVTSSQNNSKENSPAPTIKSLVDYDESDSDEEQTSPDAVPSSSTGSPIQEKETSPSDSKKSVDSPEHSDVSSTSEGGDEKLEPLEISTITEVDGLRRNKRSSSDSGDSQLQAKRHRSEEGVAEA